MEYEFEIWQDGMVVACGSGLDREAVEREAFHYFNVYRQDAPTSLIFGQPPLPAPTERSEE